MTHVFPMDHGWVVPGRAMVPWTMVTGPDGNLFIAGDFDYTVRSSWSCTFAAHKHQAASCQMGTSTSIHRLCLVRFMRVSCGCRNCTVT